MQSVRVCGACGVCGLWRVVYGVWRVAGDCGVWVSGGVVGGGWCGVVGGGCGVLDGCGVVGVVRWVTCTMLSGSHSVSGTQGSRMTIAAKTPKVARTIAPMMPAQLSLSFLASQHAESMPIESRSRVTASSQRHSMPMYSRSVYGAAISWRMGDICSWLAWVRVPGFAANLLAASVKLP